MAVRPVHGLVILLLFLLVAPAPPYASQGTDTTVLGLMVVLGFLPLLLGLQGTLPLSFLSLLPTTYSLAWPRFLP